ncbi:hypothetical protein [Dinghuibacter silviterrae]|uniref:Phosphate-selective porin O/P n=1 Tax=Dinghuibacter silviterrae TaxID=1539049 RepID=A0A4R8DQ45_9BACT|nr:hypothetical protein [Dinghuibacter silviterrae]TDW99416.1 hypothetical protein EDB95_0426 [Dinghuibacter silviterrae]
MRKYVLIALLAVIHQADAQIDSSLLKTPAPSDTVRHLLNMDAIYNRPFLQLGKSPVSIGGYFESNWQYMSTSGITVGNQFQFRRFSLFVASTISKHIKFLSEIEYENDPQGDADQSSGGEFEVEYAALDIEFHPLLNLRGGMIVNPIGAFNQNHDGPKWEFTDRPIAMSQMLPATWNNTGFGLYGRQYKNHWMYGYEFYLTGGFNDSIIDNAQGKTYLPAAKSNASRFTTSASGEPMYTGKISLRHDKIGELGLSFMSDVYNTWRIEGAPVDDKRHVHVFDADFNTTLPRLHTNIITEWAWVFVQLPPDYTPEYSNKQFGGFIDVVQPIFRGRILDWKDASINLAVRGEYVDWNVGRFAATGTRMYNDLWSIMPALSFRPTAQTVLRFNYRHQVARDITGSTIGATIGTTAGFSVGLSTYF